MILTQIPEQSDFDINMNSMQFHPIMSTAKFVNEAIKIFFYSLYPFNWK